LQYLLGNLGRRALGNLVMDSTQAGHFAITSVTSDEQAPSKQDSNPVLALPTPTRRRSGNASRKDKASNISSQVSNDRGVQQAIASTGRMPWELPLEDSTANSKDHQVNGQCQKLSYRDHLKARGQQVLQRSREGTLTPKSAHQSSHLHKAGPIQSVPGQPQASVLPAGIIGGGADVPGSIGMVQPAISPGVMSPFFPASQPSGFPMCHMAAQQVPHAVAHVDASRQWSVDMSAGIPLQTQAPPPPSADAACFWQRDHPAHMSSQMPAIDSPSSANSSTADGLIQHVQSPLPAMVESRSADGQSSPLMAIAMPRAVDDGLSNEQIAEILRTASTGHYED